MARLSLVMGLVLALPGCIRRSAELPVTSAASPTDQPWHLRLELDSAPGRTPSKQQVEGLVTADLEWHNLDLVPLIGRSVTSAVEFTVIKQTDTRDGVWFEITLGDARSDQNKLLLRGRPARAGAVDSVIGTWVERADCCRAGGRFALWRPAR